MHHKPRIPSSSSPKPCRNICFTEALQLLLRQRRLHEALRLCLDLRAPAEAFYVHARALAAGLAPSILLSNRLICLLAKNARLSDARLSDARLVFDKMPHRDACSWNTLIAAYSGADDLSEAKELFDAMPVRDHFSWSTVMSACIRCGRPREALGLYRDMQSGREARRSQSLDCDNRFTVSSALAASAAILCLHNGKEIHAHILRIGLDSDAVVWSALSDMYAKCGSLDYARHVFDATSDRDVVSWTAMIGRYIDGGRRDEGFELFSEMLRAGVRPNEFTFAAVLDACSEQASEGLGKQIHGHMMRMGFDPFSFAASALLHMYSKCGNIEKMRIVFEEMPKPDLVSWTSMISGCAQNGHPEEALRFFELMLKSGTKPDHVTFVGVLSACTHAGFVDKGLEIFHSIRDKYGIIHTADHYACVVDLLSRAGRFQEAEEIIDSMGMEPNKFLWASLLGGCRIHKNVILGKRAAEALFDIEPENAATYVTLANIYATAGLWDEVERIRKIMDERRVVKKPGSSWIEVKRRIYVFLVGDKSHPRSKDIYAYLEKTSSKMKGQGYIPDTDFVLHDVEDEQKEENLSHHSEKLAVAFGIIATSEGTCIKVFKNLRICGDCHTAIKFVSKISKRLIVVRDSSRFHHFKDGICSCGDYW